MTALSFRAVDLADKQSAFTRLLATPVAAPWIDPTLYALVTRYERDLDTWCRRLGYQLTRIDRCVRLRRPQLDAPIVPRGPAPKRRPLVLALVATAALEDQREDSVTLNELSDAVRRGTAAHGLQPYDPTQRAHRIDLVKAVRLLTDHGVLEQRTRSELVSAWEREGAGIGAGYLIHREAMVLLVDTRDAELALAPHPAPTDSRRERLLRALIETQALRTADLDDADQAYLARQRHTLIHATEEMTGGTVEVRSDALVLILPSDRGLPERLFVTFPDATAAHWVALTTLSHAIVAAEAGAVAGHRTCRAASVAAIATDVHRAFGSRLTVALRESPDAIRAAAEEHLAAAGLLHIDPNGDWVLPPEAGRYRDAELTVASDDPVTQARAEPALFEEIA